MKIVKATVLAALAAAGSGCTTVYPDPAIPYVQRTDKVTFGAGNAQAVNAATHTIDPWPRYVSDRHISGNGARMVGAIERYEGGGKAKVPAGSGNAAASSAASGAVGAPALTPLSPITPGSGNGASPY